MRQLSAILAALALSGVSAASAQGVYTTNPYLDVPGVPLVAPVQFDIAGDAGPYYYGRIVPPANYRIDEPGPLSRIGTVRSINGTLTGGNTTRTGAPKFQGAAAGADVDARYAASGVTGALSGSYRAGVGGVGGLADVGPRAAYGAVAGEALAAGAEVTPISTPAAPPIQAAPPTQMAESAPLPTAVTAPGVTTQPGETAMEYTGETYTAPESAVPVGRRTYTATYQTETTRRNGERPRRTLEK